MSIVSLDWTWCLFNYTHYGTSLCQVFKKIAMKMLMSIQACSEDAENCN